jgi:hypothetical protein
MVTEKHTTLRSRHSFRKPIREAIQARIVLGKPLTVRAILEEAGGGSSTTVLEELQKIPTQTLATRIGHSAQTLPQRVLMLEEALEASVTREKDVTAENRALASSLEEARRSTEVLLGMHHDAQRLLMQAVDDLRQMVKAGQGGLPQAVIEAEKAKKPLPGKDDDAGTFWKVKYEQAAAEQFKLDEKYRKAVFTLHELGMLEDF